LPRSSHELATRAYELASRTYWLAIAAAALAALSTVAAIIGLGLAIGATYSVRYTVVKPAMAA
jgi:uncharacterized membrane protein